MHAYVFDMFSDPCWTLFTLMFLLFSFENRLVGKLASYITQPLACLPPEMEPTAVSLSKLCLFHLNTKSALQRLAISQVVYHWAHQSLVSTNL